MFVLSEQHLRTELGVAMGYFEGRDFQTASDKLTMAESNSAKSRNLSLLIAMESFSLMFVAAGFWMLWRGEAPLIALMCLWLFGLCAVVFARMVAVKVDEIRTGTSQGN